MGYDQLPPLAFLPTLEAAGRLGSFKAAAEALHITPSAVSQQIRALEEALKVPLFERRGRNVVITKKGERYLRDVRQALRELVSAGQRLHQSSEREPLRLESDPFVAHEFLLPRMAMFRRAFPQLELRLESESKITDLETSEVDAVIRSGAGPWPGDVFTHQIGPIELALVCSAQRARSIHSIADLAKQPLLEVQQLSDRSLSQGLRARGIRVDPSRIHLFASYYDVVRAAEHGLGVTMGVFPFLTHLVTQGRLAVPLLDRSHMPGHISLVHRVRDERFPYAAIAAWVRKQYEALPALSAGRLVPGERRAARTKTPTKKARAR